MKKILAVIDKKLAEISQCLIIFLALSLTFVMALSVFLRYVLNQSFPAIEEISILVGVWFYFFSMVVVTRERSHLTGGILDLIYLSVNSRRYIKLFNDFVGLIVLAIFSYFTFKYLIFVMKINRSSTNLSWPMAIWIISAAVGFSWMALYKLRDLFVHDDRYSPYDNKSPHPASAQLTESR